MFNILISNTDDHLRNHGFLYDGAGGWRLSPAYDMNPTPLDVKARVLSLAIDEADDTASLDVAFGMARQCGLKQPAAREIVQAKPLSRSGAAMLLPMDSTPATWRVWPPHLHMKRLRAYERDIYLDARHHF